MYRLPVLEVLLSPLLQERAHALVLVLGAAGNAEGLGLESGAGVDVGLHAHADAALGFAHGDLGVGADRVGQLHGLIHQLLGGVDLADQADGLGLVGLDGLGRQNQLHSLADAHDAGQPLGAAEAGSNAQAHLGLAEPGLLAGQSDVAGHAQLTAAAQGEAVYRRNHGLGQVLQLEEHAAAVHAELLAVDRGEALHLTDVGSRHKGAARAGQNHHIDLIVRRHLVDNRVQIAQNKVAPPFREAEFDIMFGEGISKMSELIDVGVKLGIVQKSGAWFNYGDIRLGQGRDNAKQFLKDNPEIANDIEGQIRANADKLYATRRPAGRAVAAAEKPADPAAAKEPVVKAPTRSSESELDIMVED